jgi:hypothetical protein
MNLAFSKKIAWYRTKLDKYQLLHMENNKLTSGQLALLPTMALDHYDIFQISGNQNKITCAFWLLLASYSSNMSQIRRIVVGSKLPSALSSWPLWSHFNQIARTMEKTTIYSNEAQYNSSYGYNK